jgi:hypothetical protein
VLPPAAADTVIRTINPDYSLVIESLDNPEEWFGDNGAAIRERLLLDTLATAFADVSGQLGADPASSPSCGAEVVPSRRGTRAETERNAATRMWLVPAG